MDNGHAKFLFLIGFDIHVKWYADVDDFTGVLVSVPDYHIWSVVFCPWIGCNRGVPPYFSCVVLPDTVFRCNVGNVVVYFFRDFVEDSFCDFVMSQRQIHGC